MYLMSVFGAGDNQLLSPHTGPLDVERAVPSRREGKLNVAFGSTRAARDVMTWKRVTRGIRRNNDLVTTDLASNVHLLSVSGVSATAQTGLS